MYSVYQFGRMIGDDIRMRAYTAALKAAITPGCTLIDLGTGTGIFALLACRFGAGRVYAIEVDDVIHVAQKIVEANGLQRKVEFVHMDSREYDPPTKADVLVSDLRGVLPFFKTHLPTIIDARDRLLRPGGIQFPLEDRIRVAVVEAEEIYNRYTKPWGENDYGFDLSAARQLLVNNWVRARVTPAMLLSRPVTCCTIDYTTVDTPNFSACSTLSIERKGIAHGFSAWFDANIDEVNTFSNGPDSQELGYGMAFFPCETPVELRKGDLVEFGLDARLIGDDYIYGWNALVLRGENEVARFKQSTFFSSPSLYRTKIPSTKAS